MTLASITIAHITKHGDVLLTAGGKLLVGVLILLGIAECIALTALITSQGR
jgi:hypothetical protein